MSINSIEYTFFHFDLDHRQDGCLVKILSIDGRRFTYHVRATLDDGAVRFVKDCLDRVYFSDLIIEKGESGWHCRESPERLPRHG